MNRMTQPIIVIDSGIGGLKCCHNLFWKIRGEQIIYFADDLNMPYGNKSKNFLITRVDEILSFFVEFYNPKIIVFACNTAGSIYNKYLKQKYKVPIFCVSPLMNYTTNSLVISTKMTRKILSEKCLNNLTFKSCPSLASNVEHHFFDKRKIKKIISDITIENKYNNIILGCTHYELIEKEFCEIYPSVNIVCPSNKCVEEIKQFLILNYPSKLENIQNKDNIDKNLCDVDHIKAKYEKMMDNQISFLCSTGAKSYTDKLKTIFFKYL